MATPSSKIDLRLLTRAGFGPPLIVLVMLAMMVVPLPTRLLDLLFSFNIALSLVVLLAAIYVRRPLEFASFPTVLLITTLFRLALNLASTRLILLHGHTGSEAAGQVIAAFGEFVVGGNYAVGLVVFSILIIINFVVITRGAGRISEVSARFVLDAMPGKQMAIDADLNSGVLTQEEGRKRREEVRQEADFYGAMDGASKFVRGDAIAGILILMINILGGLVIGVAQHNLNIEQAAQYYTLLTIGDGLVAQIPSIVLSSATGILVTRVSYDQDMGGQIFDQLFAHPRALAITAFVLLVFGLMPGMPNQSFLILAVAAGSMAYVLHRQRGKEEAPEETIPIEKVEELDWNSVEPIDAIGLEFGYRLIPLVDQKQGGQLVPRIRAVRKRLTHELGFLVPSVHLRDNLEYDPNQYMMTIKGVVVGKSLIYPERELAINPGQVVAPIEGMPATEPAFGLEAFWIAPSDGEQAQTLGYTVVDASTVMVTHLNHVLHKNADKLLGHEELRQLLERLSQRTPKLVDDLIPKILPFVTILKIMKNLLAEGISMRHFQSIMEVLAEHGAEMQDADELTEKVRQSLSQIVIQSYFGDKDEIQVMTLTPELEQVFLRSQQADGGRVQPVEPSLLERFREDLARILRAESSGQTLGLLVAPPIRRLMSRLLARMAPDVPVLSYAEIPQNKSIVVQASVGSVGSTPG